MKVNNITRLMVACLWCCCTVVFAEDNVKPTIEKPEIVNQIDAKLKIEQERLEQALIEKAAAKKESEDKAAQARIDKIKAYRENIEIQHIDAYCKKIGQKL